MSIDPDTSSIFASLSLYGGLSVILLIVFDRLQKKADLYHSKSHISDTFDGASSIPFIETSATTLKPNSDENSPSKVIPLDSDSALWINDDDSTILNQQVQSSPLKLNNVSQKSTSTSEIPILTSISKQTKLQQSFSDKSSIFSWVAPLLSVRDDDLLHEIGLDGYIFLRFLYMLIKISSTCCIIGLPILLPVYATAPPNNPDNAFVLGVNIFSMGNIVTNGHRLWASTIFAYIFTIIFLYFIHIEYVNFANKRQLSFNNSIGSETSDRQALYTVLVENIPGPLQSSTKLKELFESVFPMKVLFATILVKTPALDKAVMERNEFRKKLEGYVALYYSDPEKERPMLKLTGYGDNRPVMFPWSKGIKTDAIQYYTKKLLDWNRKVSELQRDAIACEDRRLELGVELGGDRDSISGMSDSQQTSSGFVTFSSKATATVACTIPILFQNHQMIKITPSSRRDDIIWTNLYITTTYRDNIITVTTAIYTAGLLFWSAIILFVSSISSLSNLEIILPFISDLNPVLYALLATILPILILNIFLALIPILISYITITIEQRHTYGTSDSILYEWYFLYQLANVYLILFGGSLLNVLNEAIGDPSAIIVVIGTAVPTVAVFFINYIISSAFLGVALLLLRISPLLTYQIYRWVYQERVMTSRDYLEGPLAQECPSYGTIYPDVLYVVVIMTLEWVIAPIVLLASTVFFLLMYVGWKYQFVHILGKKYESNGRLWYSIYRSTMVALLVGSVAIIGYMGIKKGVAQSPLLAPLPAIVVLAWRYTEGQCKRLSLYAPYESSVQSEDSEDGASARSSFNQDYHRSPNIIVGPIAPNVYRQKEEALFLGRDFNPIYYRDVEDSLSQECYVMDPSTSAIPGERTGSVKLKESLLTNSHLSGDSQI